MKSVLMLVAVAACGGGAATSPPPPMTSNAATPVEVEPEPVAMIGALVPTPQVEETSPQDLGISPGPLDKAAIRRVVRANLSSISKCYEEALASRPGLEGTTSVAFVILPTGDVKSAVGSGFDPAVDVCVATAVSAMKFPPGPTESKVTYPFKFSQTGG